MVLYRSRLKTPIFIADFVIKDRSEFTDIVHNCQDFDTRVSGLGCLFSLTICKEYLEFVTSDFLLCPFKLTCL